MKKIIGFSIIMILFTTTLTVYACEGYHKNNLSSYQINNPMILKLFSDDEIDQEQTENCGHGIAIFNDTWFAQGFKPSMEILTRVQLFLFKEGNPSDDIEITVSIRESLYRSDIVSNTVNGSKITEQGEWIEFDFFYTCIIPGGSYNIVCKTNGGTEKDHFCWYFNINNPYVDGDSKYSEDYGYNWKLLNYPLGFPEKDFCFKTYGISNYAPNKPNKPAGITTGYYEVPYDYSTTTIDIDNNDLFYLWDWGDGSNSGWIGPFESGETCIAMHTWMIKGSYLVKVKAKDNWNFESEWSDTLTIRMEKNKSINVFILRLFRLIQGFPILELLLK